MRVVPFGEGRRDRRAPDIRRSWRARVRAARRRPSAARKRTRRSATSSPPSSRRSSSSIDAPISRKVANRPVRSGLVITPSSMISEPGTIRPATIGKRGGGRIGRHHHGRGHKLGLAFERDAPAMRAVGRDLNLGAEMAQHALGVVARCLGLARRPSRPAPPGPRAARRI